MTTSDLDRPEARGPIILQISTPMLVPSDQQRSNSEREPRGDRGICYQGVSHARIMHPLPALSILGSPIYAHAV